ncbi:MAG: hypothetical protein WA118_01935 [Carboxydocellales bacterium]
MFELALLVLPDLVSGLTFGLVFGFAFLLTRQILPSIFRLIREAGFSRVNYRGEPIPVGVGLVFFLACLPIGVGLMVGLPWVLSNFPEGAGYRFYQQVPLFLLGLAIMTLVGLIDDIFGNRQTTGLCGHLAQLCQRGRLTTGMLKALVGGILALGIGVAGSFAGHPGANLDALGSSYGSSLGSSLGVSWVGIMLRTLTMALSINAINLLDLRPGRAGKGFTLAAVVLLMLGWPWLFHLEMLFLLMVLGSLLAYLPRDLQARAMMGDAGANALGITLGMVSCWSLSEQGLVVYLLLLLVFQLWTEKYSLTEWIEKVPLLHFLDKLGRQ